MGGALIGIFQTGTTEYTKENALGGIQTKRNVFDFSVIAYAVCFVNLKALDYVDFHTLTLVVKIRACFRHFDFLSVVKVERSNMAQKGKITVEKSGEVFSRVSGNDFLSRIHKLHGVDFLA